MWPGGAARHCVVGDWRCLGVVFDCWVWGLVCGNWARTAGHPSTTRVRPCRLRWVRPTSYFSPLRRFRCLCGEDDRATQARRRTCGSIGFVDIFVGVAILPWRAHGAGRWCLQGRARGVFGKAALEVNTGLHDREQGILVRRGTVEHTCGGRCAGSMADRVDTTRGRGVTSWPVAAPSSSHECQTRMQERPRAEPLLGMYSVCPGRFRAFCRGTADQGKHGLLGHSTVSC